MEAKDLRIGNYVKCLLEDRQVLDITKHNGNNETARYYIGFKGIIPIKLIHIKPIPLTEEWLIKLGFTNYEWCDDCAFIKFQGKHLMLRYFDNKWICQKTTVTIDSRGQKMDNGIDIVKRGLIKHVHQLQNLYFSLTNKELKYDTKQNN